VGASAARHRRLRTCGARLGADMIPTALIGLACLTFHGPHDAHDHGGRSPQEQWERPAPTGEVVIVGDGDHRYRWESFPLQLPDGREWLGATHGCIVVDSKNRLYMSAEQGSSVLVFDGDGRFLRSFGDDWGPGLHGLCLRTEADAEGVAREVLYLAHTARREVLVTTLEGDVLRHIAPPPAETGLYPDPGQYRPTSVAVAPDGTTFVADGYGLSWVHRYDADGLYLSSFGGRGDEARHLSTPHGLWMDASGADPTLIVADRENHRIARYSLDGEFLDGTDPESGLLRRPCHLQFQGGLGVVADLSGRVTLLDRELRLVAHLGDNPDRSQHANYGVPPQDWRPAAFCAPHCARIAPDGSIWVMDWNVAGRVTRLVPVAD
jgi:hypothetical protein